jgi:lysozyme family protein
MSDFLPAFEKMIVAEGGYKLTNIANDRGGQTYAGIARKMNPAWQGWQFVDRGEIPPSDLVRGFYRENFWEPVRGDSIMRQDIADSLFSFAVNAGVGTAVKLAQIVVGATPDGKIGEKTLMALNSTDASYFRAAYAMAKITRYRDIVTRDRTQGKFLLGWINRTLKDAA